MTTPAIIEVQLIAAALGAKPRRSRLAANLLPFHGVLHEPGKPPTPHPPRRQRRRIKTERVELANA